MEHTRSERVGHTLRVNGVAGSDHPLGKSLNIFIDDLVPAEHLEQIVDHEVKQPGEETDEEDHLVDEEILIELEAEVLVGLFD